MAAHSPYSTVHAELPAMFVGATNDDIRTPAWHARKFVARAHSFSPSRPVLLRVWQGGHGTNLPAGKEITNDWLAFVMQELGMRPAMPREHV